MSSLSLFFCLSLSLCELVAYHFCYTANTSQLNCVYSDTDKGIIRFSHDDQEDVSKVEIDCGERRSTRGKLVNTGYYDGLNETGLCGAVCKHGLPLFLLNIRFGGEKMIFASTILDKLLENGTYERYLLKYDSICTFEKWREARF